jgi:hypothetical protein
VVFWLSPLSALLVEALLLVQPLQALSLVVS